MPRSLSFLNCVHRCRMLGVAVASLLLGGCAVARDQYAHVALSAGFTDPEPVPSHFADYQYCRDARWPGDSVQVVDAKNPRGQWVQIAICCNNLNKSCEINYY